LHLIISNKGKRKKKVVQEQLWYRQIRKVCVKRRDVI